MTFWVIDRKHLKHSSTVFIVRHHLIPLAEWLEEVVNKVKWPKFGRFVIFHLFLPFAEGLKHVMKQKTALKSGQKVIGNDLRPLTEGSEKVAKDFWVLAEWSEPLVKDFWVPTEWSDGLAKAFSPAVLNCYLSGGQNDEPLPRAEFVPSGKKTYVRTSV